MDDQQQQSCMTECVYCTKVNPVIGADCPHCKGQRTYEQPAQMMGGELSRQHVLQSLLRGGEVLAAFQNAPDANQMKKALRDHMLGILQSMAIYNFDLETAVIEMIQSLEKDSDPPAA